MLIPLPKAYTKPCPRCGFQMPLTCRGCWHCGKILDPSIMEPAEEIKEAGK